MANKKVISTIAGSLILVMLFIMAWSLVLSPAYYSLQNDCPEFEGSGAFNIPQTTLGTTTIYYNSQGEYIDSQIEVFTEDPEVLKHELCHVHQAETGDTGSCSNPKTIYFAEVECYVAQRLPDKIFYWLY